MQTFSLQKFLLMCGLALTLLMPPVTFAAVQNVKQATGSNANACGNAAGKATINAGIACLNSCDTLDIYNGTYNEYIGASTSIIGSPYIRNTIPNGTGAGCRTTIQAATGQFPILRPTAGATNGVALGLFTHVSTPSQWIDVIGLDFDGILCSPNIGGNCGAVTIGSGSHDLRFIGGTMRNTHQTGGGAGGGGAAFQVYSNPNGVAAYNITLDGVHIHSNGFDRWYHGIYITSHGNIVRNNNVHHTSGANFHYYYGGAFGPGLLHDNIIERNVGYQNAVSRTGAIQQSIGNLVLGGQNNRVRNNIFHDSIGPAIWLGWSSGGGQGNWLDNNTVCGASGASIRIESDTSGTILRNNISENTSGLSNSGASTTNAASNLWDAANPLFINPCTDVHLQAGSPAITGGDNLSAYFTTDFAGATRTSWGRGAYIGGAVTPITLAFLAPPTTTVQGEDMLPPVVACAQVSGVTQTSYANNITLVIQDDPGAATLTGGGATAPVNGCATFPAVRIDDEGLNYTLSASGSGATGVESSAFGISDATPPGVENPLKVWQYRQ